MKRLKFEGYNSKESDHEIEQENFKSRNLMFVPANNVRISVISSKDSVDKYIAKHADENIDANDKEIETDNEVELNDQRMQAINKLKNSQPAMNEQTQTTLKPALSLLPSVTTEIEQKTITNTLPSEIKSISLPKEYLKDKVKLARDKFEKSRQSRQSRQPGHIYVINRKLIQGQKQLIINDTKVYFPYEPYKVQLEYMENVLDALKCGGNAVLESPTGTGKTLCLLASVLSFVEKQFRGQKLKHNVIYMSRTHSQLRQVQKQLSKTCYRPNMAIFASRDQLCLKDSLSALKGREKIQACGKGVKLARKFNREELDRSDQDPKLVQTLCQFYRQREEVIAIGRSKLANTLLDIDIMKQMGREEMFCPYFYPIQTREFSNLFIMPYNYLLDAYLINTYQEIIENSIIIFDQAHNVSEAACQGRSLLLQTHNLDSALLELNKLLSKFLSPSLDGVRARYEKEIKFLVKKIEDFKQTFAAFIDQIFATKTEEQRYRRDTNSRDENDVRIINKERTDHALFELFCGKVSDDRRLQFEIRKDYYRSLMNTKLILPFQEFVGYGLILIEQLKETPDGVFNNFEKVLIFCLKIKSLLAPRVNKPEEKAWVDDELNHFRIYVNKNTSGLSGMGSYSVGLKCLVPWLTFKDIIRFKPRSILLTSGTLKPLPMWQKQLKLKFTHQLSNGHVIKQEQIAARVIKAGPSNVKFNFTYDGLNKNKAEIYKDLIEFIVQVSSRIPNGILLVFPSFRLQMDFKYQLMRSSKRERLAASKDIIFQQKSMDIKMDDFKKKALSAKGAILAIICRGKVSEGIDFPDGMCRAVIIVGIPYPNIKDPFIIEKKSHLQNIAARSTNKSQTINGEEWYFMGTIRAINQALGRVIRHALDYGMVFLIDSRYSDNRMQKELPNWIRQSMRVVDTPDGLFFNSVDEFYKTMKMKYKTVERIEEKQENESDGQEKGKKNALDILMGKGKDKKRMRTRRERRPRQGRQESSPFDF